MSISRRGRRANTFQWPASAGPRRGLESFKANRSLSLTRRFGFFKIGGVCVSTGLSNDPAAGGAFPGCSLWSGRHTPGLGRIASRADGPALEARAELGSRVNLDRSPALSAPQLPYLYNGNTGPLWESDGMAAGVKSDDQMFCSNMFFSSPTPPLHTKWGTCQRG